MRGLATIFAISVALWSVTLTSNHYRVRYYLWAHLAATFVIEAYLALGGSPSADGPYYWLYVAVSIPVLLTALLIAQRMIASLRRRDRTRWVIVSGLAGLVGLLSMPLDSRVRAFLAVQACLLAVAGMVTIGVSLLRGTAPYLTLGGLWFTQAIMFFMYAKGLTINAPNWNAVGEWLPSGIVIVGMFLLSRNYLRGVADESDTELQANRV